MANYKQLFMNYLDREGIRYTDKDDNIVKISYSGDNLKSIPIWVFFDKDGEPIVQFKCWDIANFKNKEDVGIKACNEANKQYRWMTYSLDDDADIIASLDGYLTEAECGTLCHLYLRRIVNITDEVYPIFARAMWA